jgi:DNA-binding NtrC family response regulator
LNVVQITLPPLRDRREDIPYLTAAFLREFGQRFGKAISGLALPAARRLGDASWPGNIRQLRNVLERACILADGPVITEHAIAACLRQSPAHASPFSTDDRTDESDQALSSLERQHIMKVIAETGGNKARAARQLGLSRRALYRRLERYGLTQPDSRRSLADEASPVPARTTILS